MKWRQALCKLYPCHACKNVNVCIQFNVRLYIQRLFFLTDYKHILTRVDAYLSGVQRYQKFCLMYVNNRLYSNKFNYFRPIVCHVQNRYSTTLDLQLSAVSHIMDQHCAECKRHRRVDSCVGSV